ncbi:MAG: D-glycerate dehydrogenase [Chloroflexota bacterium]|nr:D-glycerate dehydrogenase [Chloroflexota bacterium]
MPKVLVVDPALAGIAGRLGELLPGVEVAVVSSFDDAELAELADGATVFLNARRPIDARTLALAPEVRFVQLIGVGYDSVDLAAMSAGDVSVAYNPGVNRDGAAEHTVMLMLALIKRLALSERVSREGRFATGEVIAAGIDDLAGATVGLIGMGDIGTAVAERLVGFGARIRYHTRRPVQDVEARLGVVRSSLAELLAGSDIVSLHVPLSPETHHLIGAPELAAMRAGGYLVNAGRGGLVDEDALRHAIETGHLAGAALDVLENETVGRNPFADVPAIIVTPHLGGASRRSMEGVATRSAANIRRFLAGEPIVDPVPGTR